MADELVNAEGVIETKGGLSEGIQKVECYVTNVSELLQAFEENYIEENNTIKINLETLLSILQMLWDKTKETSIECEGKELIVDMPDGVAGSIFKVVLDLLKFKL